MKILATIVGVCLSSVWIGLAWHSWSVVEKQANTFLAAMMIYPLLVLLAVVIGAVVRLLWSDK